MILVKKTPSNVFDKTIYFAIHHAVHIRGLIVGTVVFHTTVIKYVASDLRTPFDFLLTGFHLSPVLPYGAAIPYHIKIERN